MIGESERISLSFGKRLTLLRSKKDHPQSQQYFSKICINNIKNL